MASALRLVVGFIMGGGFNGKSYHGAMLPDCEGKDGQTDTQT